MTCFASDELTELGHFLTARWALFRAPALRPPPRPRGPRPLAAAPGAGSTSGTGLCRAAARLTGLYTSILCLIAYALFGPSKILVLGPDSSLGR